MGSGEWSVEQGVEIGVVSWEWELESGEWHNGECEVGSMESGVGSGEW